MCTWLGLRGNFLVWVGGFTNSQDHYVYPCKYQSPGSEDSYKGTQVPSKVILIYYLIFGCNPTKGSRCTKSPPRSEGALFPSKPIWGKIDPVLRRKYEIIIIERYF